MGSENIMDELATLIRTDIPEGRQSLQDSYTNLARVAEYCEDTYYRYLSIDKPNIVIEFTDLLLCFVCFS